MKRDKTTCIKGRERLKSDDKNTFCCVLYIRVVISGCCCWFDLDKKKNQPQVNLSLIVMHFFKVIH